MTSTSQTHEQLPWILENPFGPYVATPVKYRRVALIVWTNRNHFQVIAETGQTGQLQYDGKAIGSHLFRPNWTFRNLQCSFMPKSQPPEWQEYNHSLPPYSSTLIHVSSHFYVAYNELRSPGFNQSLGFLTGYNLHNVVQIVIWPFSTYTFKPPLSTPVPSCKPSIGFTSTVFDTNKE